MTYLWLFTVHYYRLIGSKPNTTSYISKISWANTRNQIWTRKGLTENTAWHKGKYVNSAIWSIQVSLSSLLCKTIGDFFCLFSNRSIPIETVLLGPYKYLLKKTIPQLSKRQKDEVLARIWSFDFSRFDVKLCHSLPPVHCGTWL